MASDPVMNAICTNTTAF